MRHSHWIAVALLPLAALAHADDDKDEEKQPPVTVEPETKADPGASVERTLEHAGAKRTYRLHLPKAFTKGKPVPLVVCLHGATATGLMQEALSRFDAVADEKGFAVVYPDGRNRLWLFLGGGEKGDSSFIAALVDELVKEGIADARRVYSTGISNGAYLTNILALEHADKFAAFAAVAGMTPRLLAKLKTPSRAVSYLYFHGTDDKIVGYDGKDGLTRRGASLSAEEWVKFWVDHDGCKGEPKVEKTGSAERRSWDNGKDGAEVVFYKLEGGGHTWPGGAPQPERLLGKTNRDVDATRLMWEFFAKHELPEKK
jgi:polyhydroxybutyrate depolymerase